MCVCVYILAGNESDTDASENTWNRRGRSWCWIDGKLQPRRCSVEGIKNCTEMKTVLEVRTTQLDVWWVEDKVMDRYMDMSSQLSCISEWLQLPPSIFSNNMSPNGLGTSCCLCTNETPRKLGWLFPKSPSIYLTRTRTDLSIPKKYFCHVC